MPSQLDVDKIRNTSAVDTLTIDASGNTTLGGNLVLPSTKTIKNENNNNVVSVTSTGNVTVGGAGTVTLGGSGNLVLSGSGIDFGTGTDGTGTVTGGVLDDYEEGTWSASINSTVNLANTTFSSGRYTKIGRIVILNGIISTDVSASNVLTYVVLSSAPFAPDLNTVGSGFLNDNVRTGNSQVTSSSTVYVFFPAASSPVAHTGEQIEFSITYVII